MNRPVGDHHSGFSPIWVRYVDRHHPAFVVRKVEFASDGGVGKGGKVTLFINDKKVAEGRLDKTVPGRFADETFDIGMDTGSPVSTAYKSPNVFTGKIKKVTFELGAVPLGIRGDIERIERETRLRKAMSD